MATETAKFALELEDRISASSASAEDALQSLQAQIDKDSKALTQMKKAMREMQSGSSVDISAYQKLKGEIDATQDSIGKARAAFINLGGDFSKASKKTSGVKLTPKVDAPKGLDDMLGAANALPGPLGNVSKGVSGVRSMITGLTTAVGVAGSAILGVVAILAALVAVLAAVAVATAKATTELLRYAAAQADAARSERLRLEGLGTLRRWMRLTSKDAAQMSESINRVAERVPLARSEIAGYGEELHRLGIRGRAAEDALEALSIAQAVQGDRGRQRLMMLVRMAGHSEGAMANLAARVRKELGGNAAAQMRSLSMIGTKLRESLSALFTGVNIAPLSDGLYRLTRLLSQSTESGRALRAIFSTVLSAFIGELGSTTPIFEYFLKEIIILALRGAILFFRLKNAIEDAFGTHGLNQMLTAIRRSEFFKVAIVAVILVVATLAAGVAFLMLAVAGVVTIVMAFAAALYYGYKAGVWLVSMFEELVAILDPAILAAAGQGILDAIVNSIVKGVEQLGAAVLGIGRSIDSWVVSVFAPERWVALGQSMIDGLITGLTSGIERLRSAVTGLASGAQRAFRDALGIHSPSSVFAGLGLSIPQGISEGIERGSAESTAAARDVVSTSATSNVTNVRGGPSNSTTVGEFHIHLGEGGEGSEDTARRVVDALRDFFDAGLATETT